MNNRVIREYLETLKEDGELDFIFPFLLESMGFTLVSTPKNSKGQVQHGKDVIAVGPDENGTLHKWFFELKGGNSRNIDSHNFNVKDGIRESLLEMKDVPYQNSNYPGFDNLPIKYVIVHNGILKENARAQVESFINKTFKENEFERWDIDRLTNLFKLNLFDECLYINDEAYKLVKRILIQYDSPGWEGNDIKTLIDTILKLCSTKNTGSRKNKQIFNSFLLLLDLISKECIEIDNLFPAKLASNIVVLELWRWILENNLQSDKNILSLFSSIYIYHLNIYEKYFSKLLPLASQYKGLYMFNGLDSEKITYPLRCYNFLNDLMYFLVCGTAYTSNGYSYDKEKLLSIIFEVINNNSGFDNPLLDINSISLQLLLKLIFVWNNTEESLTKFGYLIHRIVLNLLIRKQRDNMFPELYSNRKELAKSIYKKSSHYQDNSSLFLLIIIQFLAYFDLEDDYQDLRKLILKHNTNLQVAIPIDNEELEINMFKGNMHRQIAVAHSVQLPETLEEFRKKFKIYYDKIELKTSKTPFSSLIFLTHLQNGIDWFPDFLDLGYVRPIVKDKTS